MTSLKYAKTMDSKDHLLPYKSKFLIPSKTYYMDGNSLGLCSQDSKTTLLETLEDWIEFGIQIWGIKEGKYYNYPRTLGAKMSQLIGARPHEVVCMGSITSNLHQLLATFYKPTENKYKILVDDLNFPSDIYAVKSILELKGFDLEESLVSVHSNDGRYLDEQEIIRAMDDKVALILLPSVLYRSAQVLDIEKITKEAHKRDILIGWDLAHGIGALVYDFNKIQPDFAVWCTYKYLNGGPGSSAGLYVNQKHFDKTVGLKGWFGSLPTKQFEMSHDFISANDAGAYLQGTPNILSMASLEGALDLFIETGMDQLRKKSLDLTDYLIRLIDDELERYGFKVGSPREHFKRGGHVALEHDKAYEISLAMRKAGVVPDYRAPNVIRLAPVPMYVSFEDVYHVVQIIKEIMEAEQYLNQESDQLVY